MTFEDLAVSRISDKLSQGNNYKTVIRYLAGIFDDETALIQRLLNLRNLNTNDMWILDEIGKFLGAYPRPTRFLLPNSNNFMIWDITPWDTVPWYDGQKASDILSLNNTLYRRYLRMIARMKHIDGTVEAYEEAFGLLTGNRVTIENHTHKPEVTLYGAMTADDREFYKTVIKRFQPLSLVFNIK